jgi:hypothetical protein
MKLLYVGILNVLINEQWQSFVGNLTVQQVATYFEGQLESALNIWQLSELRL